MSFSGAKLAYGFIFAPPTRTLKADVTGAPVRSRVKKKKGAIHVYPSTCLESECSSTPYIKRFLFYCASEGFRHPGLFRINI